MLQVITTACMARALLSLADEIDRFLLLHRAARFLARSQCTQIRCVSGFRALRLADCRDAALSFNLPQMRFD